MFGLKNGYNNVCDTESTRKWSAVGTMSEWVLWRLAMFWSLLASPKHGQRYQCLQSLIPYSLDSKNCYVEVAASEEDSWHLSGNRSTPSSPMPPLITITPRPHQYFKKTTPHYTPLYTIFDHTSLSVVFLANHSLLIWLLEFKLWCLYFRMYSFIWIYWIERN